MRIDFSRQAMKDIKSLNEPMKSRIAKAIARLPDGDIKKLAGWEGYYRARVGEYRIVFEVLMPEEITIKGVAPRGEIYKRGYR